jgi:hypothetical protein
MTAHEALEEIHGTLNQLDRAHDKADGRYSHTRGTLIPPSQIGDWSWGTWQEQLDHYVNRIAAEIHENGRPSHAMLDRLGAWTVATKMALARAENMDVTTGDLGQ